MRAIQRNGIGWRGAGVMGRRNKVSSLAVIGDEEGEEDKKKKHIEKGNKKQW